MRVPRSVDHVDDEPMSPELQPLLNSVYAEVQREPTDIRALHTTLRALLEYLCSQAGRTSANCTAANWFFVLDDEWGRHWQHLPGHYRDLLGDLGGALHDSVTAPEVAENFDSTPEQLLERLNRLTPTR